MCRRLRATTIPLLTACLLLQGCVGVVFPGTRTKTQDEPLVREKSVYGALDQRPLREPRTTAVSLRQRWGEPTSISQITAGSGGELWTYEFGRVWYGVIPSVVIPIPLALPLGREKVLFQVVNGEVVSAESIIGGLAGGACASLVGPDGRPWADAGSWKRIP